MNLTEQQRDALVELANIGVSRAATQLSQLLNETIKMNVPEVAVVKLDNLGIHFRYLDEEKVVVYQDMSGCLEGRAHLVFELEECGSLIQLLLGSLSISEDVDLRSYEHEALTELANIVITTCIVTLAGALGDEILLTVPTYGRPLLSKEFFGTRGADEDQVKAARISAGLIRKLRKRLGLSQDQLALLVGVTSTAVAFWENGRTRPGGGKKAAIVALRKLGRREVKDILAQKAAERPAKKKAAKRKTAKRKAAKRKVRAKPRKRA